MLHLQARIISNDKNMADVIDMTTIYNNLPDVLPSVNWDYVMRRNMQEIIHGVYLGPFTTAQRNNRTNLLDKGITHIVCVRHNSEDIVKPQFSEGTFTYLTLEISDMATEGIIKHFIKVRQFIDDALAKNSKVLVHGHHGISRCAALVLAYIMEKFGMSYREAYQYVKNRRACIKPNEGFISQLEEYEPIYRARQSIEQGGSSCDVRRHKRKSEQLLEVVDIDLIQPPPSPTSECGGPDYRHEEIHDISNHLHRLWQLKTA